MQSDISELFPNRPEVPHMATAKPIPVFNEDNYELLKAPMQAQNLMASHKNPRVHPGVPAEFADHVSRMLQRGELSVDPTTGNVITGAGQTLPELGEFWLSTRPHCIITDPPKEEKEILTTRTQAQTTHDWRRFRAAKRRPITVYARVNA
jgi:xanthine/CO dehydrogenase XdhC/CoxF family maturation factor